MPPSANAVPIPLPVFGGLNTEMAPSDLPEGVSPDCGDVVFLPGRVETRPGLARALVFPQNSGAVVYQKQYVQPNGVAQNLFLTADGSLWLESPAGVPTLLTSVTPGSRAMSVTAFGREYIAISDGLHGSDIPLQWDGTNLDRVTQDGVGASPTVANYQPPSVPLVVGTAGAAINITTATPIYPEQVQTGGGSGYGGYSNDGYGPPQQQPDQYTTYYTTLEIATSAAHGLTAGQAVTIAGNSLYSQTTYVSAVDSASSFRVPYFGTSSAVGNGGTVATSGAILVRKANTVTATTASAHGLQPGYKAQISGVPASTVGMVDSVVVDNEDSPGLATVTTSGAHGLTPGLVISISGIQSAAAGGSIATVTRYGNELTVVTAATHNLSIGSVVNLAGTGGDGTANGQFVVDSIVDTKTFTAPQVGTDSPTGGVTGGTVTVVFPGQTSAHAATFTIANVPSATTFQVPISYPDGTWTTGSVTFPWDGTFYVLSVPSSNTFTYSQGGPDASENAAGTVTPIGQIAPGKHSLVVLFQTRQGFVTAPSPPVSFTANGSGYIVVSNLPIGPPNVIGRALALTGAGGDFYFYLPVAPRNGNQVVGTSTVINDNTTTSVLLDFGDDSLFAGLSIDSPGNNLFGNVVLGGALGVFSYADRMIWWGDRNKVGNLLNMSFDGGSLPSAPTSPAGWTIEAAGGTLGAGRFGQGWVVFGGTGQISQGAAYDAYGAPIVTGNTSYSARFWANGTGSVTVTLAGTGFTTTATVAVMATGYQMATLPASTPTTVPADLVFRVSTVPAGTLVLDELELIYAAEPYRETTAWMSYANNPETINGVTGVLGAESDPTKLMGFFGLRDTLYLLTDHLYETSDAVAQEPSSWQVEAVAKNCGLISAFAVSAGEEFAVWASRQGARIFSGEQPWKISQEIQPDWDAINPAAYQTVWCLNDLSARRMYFGVPMGSAISPSSLLVLDYRELDTANQIGVSAPVHTSYSGKLISTDMLRKWTRWNRAISSGSYLTGRGICLGSANLYSLSSQMHDDDFGAISSYYTTYFFTNYDTEQALNQGYGRKLYEFLLATVTGTGILTVVPFANRLSKPQAALAAYPLQAEPNFDLERLVNVVAGRVAFRYAATPASGEDASFSLSNMVVFAQKNTNSAYAGVDG